MPRPKKHDRRISTAVRLSESLHMRLEKEADRRQFSMNALVVRAIERYIDVLEAEKELP